VTARPAPPFTPFDLALAALAVAQDALDERYPRGQCAAVDEAR
jgi:hypothetical protein